MLAAVLAAFTVMAIQMPAASAVSVGAIFGKVNKAPALVIVKSSSDNKVGISWSAEGKIDHSTVTRTITNSVSGGAKTADIYNGTETQLNDELSLENGMWEVAYNVTAYIKRQNGKLKAISGSARFFFSKPESFTLSAEEVSLNKGKTIKLDGQLYPAELTLTQAVSFTSSDPAVAAVDATGLVTAVGAGTATITGVYGNNVFKDTCTVNVADGDPAYSVYAERVQAPMDMIAGRDNRIWGLVTSETGIEYVQIKIYNSAGALELSHKVSIMSQPTTYDLWRIRSNVQFSKLSEGTKTFKVFVKNATTLACVFKSNFNVMKADEYTDLKNMLIRWGMTRINDPYSQALRGTGNYTDCSYFTQWCYRQIGITIPTSSSSQAKWAIDNNRLVSLDSLENGDLLFYTYSGQISTNTYHVGIYYNGGVLEAGRRGVQWNKMSWNGTPAFAARVFK